MDDIKMDNKLILKTPLENTIILNKIGDGILICIESENDSGDIESKSCAYIKAKRLFVAVKAVMNDGK